MDPTFETLAKRRYGTTHKVDPDVVLYIMEFLTSGGQPANFKIMLTNKCNLSCSYCFQQHKRELTQWTPSTLDAVFDAFVRLDVSECWNTTKTWDWFGGEPLLNHKTILSFMERNAETINSSENIDFAITTNGTLLTNSFVEQYLSFKNTLIIVSLDTLLLDIDNRNHTETTIRSVVKGLKAIADIAGPYNTTVTMTISPEQVPTLRSVLQILYAANVRNFLINPLIYHKTQLVGWTEDLLFSVRDIVLQFASEYPDSMFEFGEEITTKKANCLTGGRTFAIDGSGDVFGCFFFSNDKRKHENIILANVFSGEITKIYNELDAANDKFIETDPKCQTCNHHDLCTICPAGVYDTTQGETYFRSNDYCQIIIDISLQLSDYIKQNIEHRESQIQRFNKESSNNPL